MDIEQIQPTVTVDDTVTNMDNQVIITGLGRAEAVGLSEEIAAFLTTSMWGKYAASVDARLCP